jgi:DNA-binding CsgD family transcriptional regulator
MAGIFDISVNTMQNERKHLYKKLGVHSIEEAISFATNHRLIFV